MLGIFKTIGAAIAKEWGRSMVAKAIMVFQGATLAIGIKGFFQARNLLAKGQDILANKTAAGGKIPVIYGRRRVGAQIVYMDTASRRSKDLFIVYALSVGECEEIEGRTIELDGNPITDPNRFRDGSYIGSDKINSGAGSLNTADQVGTNNGNAVAGGFGTNPAHRYRAVFNLHHGAATQTADPMLRASVGSQWTTAHKLNGITYIAASYEYDTKAMFKSVPQLTVVVKGQKVYDPRFDSTVTGGSGSQRLATPSTYAWNDNAACCFLNYLTNDQYGKGLTASDLDLESFRVAAALTDTLVDTPDFNGSFSSTIWSASGGTTPTNVITFANESQWSKYKLGDTLSLKDSNGNLVVNEKTISDIQRNVFYGQSQQNIIIIDDEIDDDYDDEGGTSLVKSKRFHCNGVIDTNKNVMENAKELLGNMRGILNYVNGKYELLIEDTGSSEFTVTDDHIIDGISIDYGNKDNRANKVVVEFFNGAQGYEQDTATVYHNNSTSTYKDDDGGEELEVKVAAPLAVSPYVAWNMGKAVLERSRYQTSINFLATPELYKVNVGSIITVTYAGLGLSSKLFRIETMDLQANGLIAISAIEYIDIYTWQVPPVESVPPASDIPTGFELVVPTGLVLTDTSANNPRAYLSWTANLNYPVDSYRVIVLDSNSNSVINAIVNSNYIYLDLLPVGTYNATVTAINSVGTESEPSTPPYQFTIAKEPIATDDVQDNAITNVKVNDLSAVKINTGELNLGTASGMAVKQAKSGYTDNTTGFWLGNDGGTPKFNIGTSTNHFKFDGTGVSIKGALEATALTIDGNATISGTLDASHITVDGDALDTLLGVAGTGANKVLSLGYDAKNKLEVTGTHLKYTAYDQQQANGDLALDMFETSATFYPSASRIGWIPTVINAGGQVTTRNLELNSQTTPTYSTSNLLYNVGGALYWNGNAVGTGNSFITSIVAGTNLNGGGSTGTVTLNLDSTITGNHTFSNNVIIGGDLTVQGTTVTVDTTNLDVKDKNITINYSTGDSSASANGAGITIQDAVSQGNDATLTWNTSNDSFNFTHAANVTGNIGVTGTVDGRDIATDGTKLDGIEAGATTDQTQAQINALGITAIGLSGTPNITVGTINSVNITSGTIDSSGTSNFDSIQLTDASRLGFGTVKSGASIAHTASVDEGIFWHQHNGYGIYRTLGAWSSPNYQQLKIKWETGIEIDGSGTTYGKSGINFLNGNIKMDGTQIIDASRNLSNIGNLGLSGSIQGQGNFDIRSTGNIFMTYGDTSSVFVRTNNGTNRLVLDASGNATFAGVISSGAITTSGNLTASQSVLSIINNDIRLKTSGDETMLRAVANGAVEIMHNNSTKLATTSGGVSVTGGLDVGTVTSTGNLVLNQDSGTIFIGADLDLRITHSGSAGTITNNTGDLTLDIAGNIELDADGGQVIFKDSGTNIGRLENSSSNFVIKSMADNKDIIFKGEDGGNDVVALTLDMSDAGTALFNHDVKVGSGGIVQSDTINNRANNANIIYRTGSTTVVGNNATALVVADSGAITTSGTLTVDAGSNGMIDFGNVTAAYGRLYADSTGTYIGSKSNHSLFLRTNNQVALSISTDRKTTINSAYTLPNYAGNAGQALRLPLSGTELEWYTLTSFPSISVSGTATVGALDIPSNGTNDTRIEIGTSTLASHNAYIDLVGDTTYTDYGLRLIRYNSGANTNSQIVHRGTGGLFLEAQDAGSVVLKTNGSDGLTLNSSGNVILTGKLQAGTTNSVGSSAIAQFGGFVRAATYYILHESVASANQAFWQLQGNDSDFRTGAGAYTGVIRANGYKVGTTTVIDASRNLFVATGASSGKFAVMATSVHPSFDFYNNGTSYFNGSVTVDDALNISGSNRALKIEGTTVIDASRNLTNIGTVTTSGNVKIALGSPSLILQDTTDDDDHSIRFMDSGGTNRMSITTLNDNLNFETTGSRNFTFNGSSSGYGNVGIGTSSPSRLLESNSNASDVPQIRAAYNSTNYLDIKHNLLNAVASGGNDNLIIQTASTERMRIDSSGNVGIGVTPETDWHSNYKALQLNTGGAFASYASGTTFGTAISTNQRVTGNTFINGNKYIASAPASLYLQQNTGVHSWYTAASGTADATISWAERMRIDSSGNVGIGTATPNSYYAKNLVVSAANEEGITIAATATSATNYLLFADGTSGDAAYRGQVAYSHSADNLDLVSSSTMTFKSGSSRTERMRIDASGNVGIGTSSPTSYNSNADNLVIAGSGNTGLTIAAGTSDDNNIFFSDGTSGDAAFRGIFRYSHADDAFKFFTAGANERMRIDSSGNVGIGVTPSAKLHINLGTDKNLLFAGNIGEIGSVAGFQAVNDAGSALGSFGIRATDMRFATGSSERMRIDSSGNVGIGVSDPEKKLEVKSDTTNDGILIDVLSKPEIIFRDRGNSDTIIGTGRHALDGFHIDTYSGNALFIRGSDREVGIGKTNPTQKLDVNGNIGINGTQVIDASRNLTNIGTIASTGLTVTKTTQTDIASFVNNNGSIILGHYGGGSQIDLGSNIAFRIRQGSAIPLSINTSGNTTFSGTINSGSAITSGGTLTATSAGEAQVFLVSTAGVDNTSYIFNSDTNFGNYNGTDNHFYWFYDRSAGNFNVYAGSSLITRANSSGLQLHTGGYQIGGTTVIDASRNLTNISSLAIGTANNGNEAINILHSGHTGQGIANTRSLASFGENISGSVSGLWVGAMTNETTAVIGSRTATGNIAFQTYSSGSWGERARITNLGTVLVGKTAEGTNTDGIELNRQDVIVATRNGDAPLILNRRTSDGDIAVFRKDNTVIGSIGTDSGSLVIGGGDVGIGFYQSADALVPINGGTRALRDSAIDLGLASGGKFKNLYLSGITTAVSYQINGTTVIDSTRDLTNIGNLSLAGDIYGTGNFDIRSTGNIYNTYGNSSSIFFRTQAGATKLTLDANGNGVFAGDVQAYSDERLKDNIQTLDGKKALQMRGVSFTRDGKPSSGVIAQEVEKIAPELVMTAEDEMGTKSVAYGNLVGYLIETVKDQQAQIDELKAMIEKVT